MKTSTLSLIALFLLVGTGCVPSAQSSSLTTKASTPDLSQRDPYDGWAITSLSGILTLRIPPGCRNDVDTNNTMIVCPSRENLTPPPDMSISIERDHINVSRRENPAWEHWDAVIASIQIQTPLTQEVQLTIQK